MWKIHVKIEFRKIVEKNLTIVGLADSYNSFLTHRIFYKSLKIGNFSYEYKKERKKKKL